MGLNYYKRNMDQNEILKIIKTLSSAKGFYKKLYENILDNPKYLKYLESMKFKDSINLILYLKNETL